MGTLGKGAGGEGGQGVRGKGRPWRLSTNRASGGTWRAPPRNAITSSARCAETARAIRIANCTRITSSVVRKAAQIHWKTWLPFATSAMRRSPAGCTRHGSEVRRPSRRTRFRNRARSLRNSFRFRPISDSNFSAESGPASGGTDELGRDMQAPSWPTRRISAAARRRIAAARQKAG